MSLEAFPWGTPTKAHGKQTNNLSAHRLVQILLTWNKISVASLAPQRKNFKAAKVLLEVCLMKHRHLVANLIPSFHDINLCNSLKIVHI